IDVPPGRTVVQRIGAEGADLTGRVLLPEGIDLDWDHSTVRLDHKMDWPAPIDGKPRLAGTQRIRRSSHFLKLQADGSFRIFGLLPAEQDVTLSLSLSGAKRSDSGWTKVIHITPDMFEGKGPRTPIDLGEIQVVPENK